MNLADLEAAWKSCTEGEGFPSLLYYDGYFYNLNEDGTLHSKVKAEFHEHLVTPS